MGRFGKRTRKGAPARRDEWSYRTIERENAAFEAYYRAMGVVAEDEWDAFMSSLRTDLPATFRVTGHRYDAAVLRTKLSDGSLLASLAAESAASDAPTEPIDAGKMLTVVPWYKPEGTAWKIDAGRRQVRSDAAYKVLHRWLVAATENGDISRQEAVSMVPPLLLDVGSSDIVLDMCAAPGSKTAQLIEAMHVSAESEASGSVPTGGVIANDADRNRSYMLYHQVSRVLSPCLVVTNMDASSLPVVRRPDGSRVLFDRVLADVPCSGDGTLRKNVGIWNEWAPGNAMGLHALQVRILRRGVELLKPGGRLVYSTCSLNPIENEAVVATILAEFGAALSLVDVGDRLPELVRRPGLSHWPVVASLRDGEIERYECHDDVPANRRRVVKHSFFARREYAAMHLERCVRILPHLQDTGGFFVAVLERASVSSEDAVSVNTENSTTEQQTPNSKGFTAEGDLVPVAHDHPTIAAIFEYYGIDAAAVAAAGYGIFTRAGTGEDAKIKNVTFVSREATHIVASASVHGRIRLVNAGVRVFEVYEPSKRQLTEGATWPCEYRVLAEGAAMLLPLLSMRTAEVSVDNARRLLSSDNSVILEDVSDIALLAIVNGAQGGAVLYVRVGPDAAPLAIPVWVMSAGRVKAFVPAANRPAMLLSLA